MKVDENKLKSKVVEEFLKELEKKSWAVIENITSKSETLELIEDIQRCISLGLFKSSHIGSGDNKILNEQIRSSKTVWINRWDDSPTLNKMYHLHESLMSELKSFFRLPLQRFESQFAHYQNGDFYKKHLDQLAKTKHRQFTSILYLNQPESGGELVIYSKDNKNKIDAKITPTPGKFVVFISKDIFHEVLPCQDNRYSLTTWYRDDFLIPF